MSSNLIKHRLDGCSSQSIHMVHVKIHIHIEYAYQSVKFYPSWRSIKLNPPTLRSLVSHCLIVEGLITCEGLLGAGILFLSYICIWIYRASDDSFLWHLLLYAYRLFRHSYILCVIYMVFFLVLYYLLKLDGR